MNMRKADSVGNELRIFDTTTTMYYTTTHTHQLYSVNL